MVCFSILTQIYKLIIRLEHLCHLETELRIDSLGFKQCHRMRIHTIVKTQNIQAFGLSSHR